MPGTKLTYHVHITTGRHPVDETGGFGVVHLYAFTPNASMTRLTESFSVALVN